MDHRIFADWRPSGTSADRHMRVRDTLSYVNTVIAWCTHKRTYVRTYVSVCLYCLGRHHCYCNATTWNDPASIIYLVIFNILKWHYSSGNKMFSLYLLHIQRFNKIFILLPCVYTVWYGRVYYLVAKVGHDAIFSHHYRQQQQLPCNGSWSVLTDSCATRGEASDRMQMRAMELTFDGGSCCALFGHGG